MFTALARGELSEAWKWTDEAPADAAKDAEKPTQTGSVNEKGDIGRSEDGEAFTPNTSKAIDGEARSTAVSPGVTSESQGNRKLTRGV